MLDNYSNIEEVGKGGFGCVYKAYDSITGKKVAIKMMSNKIAYQPLYRNLFTAEVNTLKALDHNSIVHIIGSPFSDSQGNLFLPMEFIEGETLKQHITTYGAYSEQEAINIMSKVLDAMQYVYEKGKIHRDIKPSNIMIRPDGSICVIDFGIAKDSKISTGQTVGTIIGTDGYMSPEQAVGNNIDHRTDIYSLGCTLYYILTGHDAIAKKSNDYDTRMAVIEQAIPDITRERPDISRHTADVIAKATDKNMLLRYQTPLEFKYALTQETPTHNTTAVNATTTISIGSLPDNDIVVSSQYVSRHHAIIEISNVMFGNSENTILFKDTSTNGTGINGRYIRQATERIDLADTIDHMPEILLAGRAETAISWQEIDEIYISKTGISLFEKPIISTPDPSPTPTDEDRLSFGWWILIILIPILGIIEYGLWKKETPNKARTALILGIVMIIVNNLIVAIINQL